MGTKWQENKKEKRVGRGKTKRERGGGGRGRNCYWLLGHLGRRGQFCYLFVRVMALQKEKGSVAAASARGGEGREWKNGREERGVIKVRRRWAAAAYLHTVVEDETVQRITEKLKSGE